MSLFRRTLPLVVLLALAVSGSAAHAGLFVVGEGNDAVLEYNGTTGAFVKTFTSGGSLSAPVGLVFGPNGDLFVSGDSNNAVLEYNGTTGAFIGSFAQTTGACSGLSLPRDLTFGPNGNLFVTSFGSGDVFEFNGTTGACVSDFIPADTGGLGGPTFVLFGEPTSGTTVPEPSSLALAFYGLTVVAAMSKRRGRQ